MLEVIRLWLNGKREYFPGLLIASKFCENNQLMQVMRTGENSRNKVRLLDLMESKLAELSKKEPSSKIADKANKIAQNANLIAINVNKVAQKAKVITSDHMQSSIYIAAKESADKAYKTAMNLRAVLFSKAKVEQWEDPNTPERVQERSKLAIDVVIGYRKSSRLYEEAAFIAENGSIPEENQEHEKDFANLPSHLVHKTLLNTRKALSKLLQKEKTAERILLIETHRANIKKLEALCRTLD